MALSTPTLGQGGGCPVSKLWQYKHPLFSLSRFLALIRGAIYRLYRRPPPTMRVALLVLAFAAVFVLANPDADKKKKNKKTAAAAAPAEPAPEADAPPADESA
ncbi:hypothetical protein PTI98_008298 [Pleurotus ostreatus]|nr:hypothetical protein PTI98_008298 [Pleurotus ostreatus]